jgi:hypothetical protein
MKALFKRAIVALMAVAVMIIAVPTRAENGSEAIEAAEYQIETPELIQVSESEGMSNDEAAAGYISRLMHGSRLRLLKSGYAGSKLQGRERKLYLALRSQIEQVAAGTLASTEFAIPVKDVYDDIHKTPEELGIVNFDPQNPRSAVIAFLECSPIDFSLVIDALLADCPYDLYWYDKAGGFTGGYPSVGIISYGQTNYELCFAEYETKTFKIEMSVSEDYQNGSEFLVDTTYGQSAVQAAVNARAIVSAHAGEGDLTKLISYKNEICNLTDYNHDAADDDDTPYGDPWQMVWVFDGNENTKVVCEGYSKAFQFLCDESEFSQDTIYSILVSGMMSGGTGAGGHMWNVVSMEDGKKYLADITNSDAGSIGQKGELFLTSYSEYDPTTQEYIYAAGNSTVSYIFGDETINLFSAEDLALSATEYRIKCTEGFLHMEIPLKAGKQKWIEFTPGEAGEYAFYTTGEADTCGEIYTPDETLECEDDDSGAGENFFMHRELQAGTTYLLAIGIQGSGTTGSTTVHIEPYIPMTSLTAGILELCPGEEGEIIPTWTPENATNIGIEIELLENIGGIMISEEGHVTAMQSGQTTVRVSSAGNPEVWDDGYILVHEPVTITSDSRMTTENRQIRIHLHGEGDVSDTVNRFTICFSDSIDGTGRFEYAGCEYSPSGTATYPVAVNSGFPYEDQSGVKNHVTIRSQESMYNDLPLNFDLTLIFNITDNNLLPEETLQLSITQFEIGCLSITNKDTVLPYTRYVTNPLPMAFELPGMTSSQTDAEFDLPAGTLRIEEEAFAGIRAERIWLPEGITAIGNRAFADCEYLTGIYIPDSCETIAENAFEDTEQVVIFGKTGSAAQDYAEQKRILFINILP